jgi:phosphoglycerate dehydrogenase-like enzyme
MNMVTTKRAQELLEQRGLTVSYPTIAQWVREGRFAGAVLDETERGPVWRIPIEAVKSFDPPRIGRPPNASPSTEKTATRAVRASNEGSSSKKKRGKK